MIHPMYDSSIHPYSNFSKILAQIGRQQQQRCKARVGSQKNSLSQRRRRWQRADNSSGGHSTGVPARALTSDTELRDITSITRSSHYSFSRRYSSDKSYEKEERERERERERRKSRSLNYTFARAHGGWEIRGCRYIIREGLSPLARFFDPKPLMNSRGVSAKPLPQLIFTFINSRASERPRK